MSQFIRENMELQGGSPALWEEVFDAFNTVPFPLVHSTMFAAAHAPDVIAERRTATIASTSKVQVALGTR
jgi:hypothetical protein